MAKAKGGKRPGAGRPATVENGSKHEIYLSAPDWDKLKRIGEGSASYGIRSLLQPGQCPECGAAIGAEDLVKHQEAEHGTQDDNV
jgi:hypothetical protein